MQGLGEENHEISQSVQTGSGQKQKPGFPDYATHSTETFTFLFVTMTCTVYVDVYAMYTIMHNIQSHVSEQKRERVSQLLKYKHKLIKYLIQRWVFGLVREIIFIKLIIHNPGDNLFFPSNTVTTFELRFQTFVTPSIKIHYHDEGRLYVIYLRKLNIGRMS